MTIEDRQIREFLLGSASERDEEEIGLALITDATLPELMDHAEEELVEDYLDGRMRPDEAALFHENFLVTPGRRELLRELKLLREGLRGTAAAPESPRAGFYARILSIFSRRPLAAVGVLGAFIAALLLGYAILRDGRTDLEIEYAAYNRSDLADPAKTSGLYTIGIIPGTLRDSASTATHPASKFSDRVVFRLALMTPAPEGSELEVSVVRSGRRIFTVPGRVVQNAFGSELRFIAPRAVLTPGNYEIGVNVPGSAHTTYHLRIE